MLGKPYMYVTDPYLLNLVLDKIRNVQAIGVDVETCRRRDLPPSLVFDESVFKPGLDPYISEIRLLQIATPKNIFVIDLFHVGNRAIQILRPIFEGFDVLKILHNSKFDLKMMMHQFGWHLQRVFCTMLGSQILSNGISEHKRSHNLANVVQRYLKIEINKDEQTSDWGQWELTSNQIKYAAVDVDVLHDLCMAELKMFYYIEQTKSSPGRPVNLKRIATIESNCSLAVAKMELDGVYIDRNIWDSVSADLEVKQLELTDKLKEALGDPNINLDSPAQIKRALHNLGIDVPNTNEKETLAPLAKKHAVIALLLDYRGATKLLTSYGNGAPGKKRRKGHVFFAERIHPITGRIHPEFDQCMTETGRFNCSKPNIQQVPNIELAGFRYAFTGQTIEGIKNQFIVADYSNFELRILAELSGDKNLLKAFLMGLDIHTAVASLMFGVPAETIMYKDPVTGEKLKGPNYWMRSASKSISFGIVYGRGDGSLATQIGVTREEAKRLMKKFFSTYPDVQVYLERSSFFGSKNGYITTPAGRIRYFQFDYYDRRQRGSVERESKNTPIQGTNADIIKIAMYRLYNRLQGFGDNAKMVNVVHDELGAEARPNIAEEVCAIIKHEMEEAAKEVLTQVPVIAEAAYGTDWTIK